MRSAVAPHRCVCAAALTPVFHVHPVMSMAGVPEACGNGPCPLKGSIGDW